MGCLPAMISHQEIQSALSARLDGEDAALESEVIDAHLAQCPQCQQFWDEALSLRSQMQLTDVDRAAAPPNLNDVILAGVNDPWRKLEQRRMVTLAIGRIALVVMALVWLAWAVQAVVAATTDPMVTSFAAVRLGVATALGLCAWRPSQVPGVLLVVGTMFTFTVGFAVRDAILGTSEFGFGGILIPLVSAIALVWTWVADRGIEVRRAWSYLSANPY